MLYVFCAVTGAHAGAGAAALSASRAHFCKTLAVAAAAAAIPLVVLLQVTFTRRKQLSLDQCESSRDYYDVCLADENNETTIRPPEDVWKVFRPSTELVYSDCESPASP